MVEKIGEDSQIPLTKKKRKIKAVALVSGGLDGAIAAKLVIDQGIDVIALTFHSPFYTCSSGGCSASIFAEKLKIPIKHLSKGDEYLEIVKNPKFSYGKNINPCIDCRIHILETAKEYMEKIGAEFIITGEVLGQRPKSQMINALKTIEKESGLSGKILRPLSAKLLTPTDIENSGIIDRSKLLDIKGRRRNIQVELGKKYELIEQYFAGGGCRLTDKHFADKLRDYFSFHENPKMTDMKFLRIGRHFRKENLKFIVGRNEQENMSLESWIGVNDVLLYLKDEKGPNTLIENVSFADDLEIPAQITLRYSDSISDNVKFIVKNKDSIEKEIFVRRNSKIEDVIDKYKI